jgi:hypothetical protein
MLRSSIGEWGKLALLQLLRLTDDRDNGQRGQQEVHHHGAHARHCNDWQRRLLFGGLQSEGPRGLLGQDQDSPPHSLLLPSFNALGRMAGASSLHLRLGHHRLGDAKRCVGHHRLLATPAQRQRCTLAARTSRCVPHISEAHGTLDGHLWIFVGRNWYAFREQLNSVEQLWLKWDRISTFILACAAVAFLARRER